MARRNRKTRRRQQAHYGSINYEPYTSYTEQPRRRGITQKRYEQQESRFHDEREYYEQHQYKQSKDLRRKRRNRNIRARILNNVYARVPVYSTYRTIKQKTQCMRNKDARRHQYFKRLTLSGYSPKAMAKSQIKKRIHKCLT